MTWSIERPAWSKTFEQNLSDDAGAVQRARRLSDVSSRLGDPTLHNTAVRPLQHTIKDCNVCRGCRRCVEEVMSSSVLKLLASAGTPLSGPTADQSGTIREVGRSALRISTASAVHTARRSHTSSPQISPVALCVHLCSCRTAAPSLLLRPPQRTIAPEPCLSRTPPVAAPHRSPRRFTSKLATATHAKPFKQLDFCKTSK